MASPWSTTGVFPGGGRQTRPTEPNVPPPNWNSRESTIILTDFKQHVEKTELQAGELVVVEIPIDPSFLKTPGNQKHGHKTVTGNTKQGRSYHKTITIVFSPCFLEKRDNQGPHSHDVRHNINKFRHRKTTGQDGLLQRRSRSHPVATLRPLQPVDDKLRHGVRVQGTENTRGRLLKAPFEEAQIEQWVLDQLLLIPAAQEADVRLHQSMRTPLDRHHTNIRANCVNDAPKCNHLLAHVPTKTV